MNAVRDLFERAIQMDGLAEVCLRASGDPSGARSPSWVGGVVGSSFSLLAALVAHRERRPLLLVVKDQKAVESVCDDLTFWNRTAGDGRMFEALPFPHLETLPYEEKPPAIDIKIDRMRVRRRLLEYGGDDSGALPVIVAPVRALMRRLPSNDFLSQRALRLEAGQVIDRERLAEDLVRDDYEFQEMVSGPGEFSTRGGIIDIYPVTADAPIRIELWGDEIDSIRRFDVATQRSIHQIDREVLLPANEVHLTHLAHEAGSELLDFTSLLDARFSLLVREPREIREEAQRVEALIHKMFEEIGKPAMYSGERSILEPAILYARLNDVHRSLESRGAIFTTEFRISSEETGLRTSNLDIRPLSFTGQEHRSRLADLAELRAAGNRVLVVCDNDGQERRLKELFADSDVENPRALIPARAPDSIVGEIHDGFHLHSLDQVLVTDREIFKRYRRFASARRHGIALPIEDIVDIKAGDFVVHIDHGVGRYMGLKRIEVEGKRGEYLELRYLDDAVLYVPIDMIEKVGRYIGSDAAPPQLARLGGKAWQNTKARAKKAIEDMANELLEIYASRQIHRGHSFGDDTPWQHEFESSFLYTETPDQLRSIEEVKADMLAPRPMDRLLCGDVGFGKTEVAIRAAFKAVMDGRQVAVLVPTTVLAQQHYRTFGERMADYPVQVDMLSRFRTPAEQKRTLEGLETGEVDICIGTHRLLSKDIHFRNLGLIIIDEEQRFGVKHKERLKKMRLLADCLTMTATPIPRTLYLSLSGIRDMSTVNTPPSNRLPVETYVADFKPEIIESAILRELARGGQVFFLHNRVESIGAIADMVSRLVPEARIAVGHGQMQERELASIMDAFVDGQHDILVCTTIIESGIDIPNVNTIIINRADRFGLSELYQLRGRVGRDRHKAYCYLLVPAQKALSRVARQRLLAIQEFTDLGSGFKVALRDLEIRGMGNILGGQQHGHIAAIGFELYNRLLRETVAHLKGAPDKVVETEVDTDDRGAIEENYVVSPRQRMNLYKRLAQIRGESEIAALRDEVTDRFGRLPRAAQRVFDMARLRVLASQAGVTELRIVKGKATLKFTTDGDLSGFSPEKVLALDGEFPEKFNVRLVDAVLLDITGDDPQRLEQNLGPILERLAAGYRPAHAPVMQHA